MSNFSALKTAIQNAIKQNGNEEITGDVLQQILLSIVSSMGDGSINTIELNLSHETIDRQEADTQLQNAINAINTYLAEGYFFAGVATPTGTPVSGRVFYVATTAGTYTSFGNLQVQNGISILLVENGSWTLYQLLVVDSSLVQNSRNPVRGGAIYQAIQHEETERHVADTRLQNNINNENSRAVGVENGLHQEIQGIRNDVLDLIHEYRPIEIEGNVVNAPDEEDITQQPNNLLKFKDKDYNPTIFSGLGRKYLRKNVIINEDYTSFDGFEMNPEADAMLEGQPDSIFWDRLRERFIAEKDGVYYLDWQGSGDYIPVSTNKIYVNENIPYFWNGEDLAVDDDVIARYGNILTQEMMSDANTIYVIQYDFTLSGNVTVPANCVLEFNGGSLNNGSIEITNNTIVRDGIFNDCSVTLSGNNITIKDCSFTNPNKNTALSHSSTPIQNITIVGCKFASIGNNLTGTASVYSIYLQYASYVTINNNSFSSVGNLYAGKVQCININTVNAEIDKGGQFASINIFHNTFSNIIYHQVTSDDGGEMHFIIIEATEYVKIDNNIFEQDSVSANYSNDSEPVYVKCNKCVISNNIIKGIFQGESCICIKSYSNGGVSSMGEVDVLGNMLIGTFYSGVYHTGVGVIEGNTIKNTLAYAISIDDTMVTDVLQQVYVRNNVIETGNTEPAASTGTSRSTITILNENTIQSEIYVCGNNIKSSNTNHNLITIRYCRNSFVLVKDNIMVSPKNVVSIANLNSEESSSLVLRVEDCKFNAHSLIEIPSGFGIVNITLNNVEFINSITNMITDSRSIDELTGKLHISGTLYCISTRTVKDIKISDVIIDNAVLPANFVISGAKCKNVSVKSSVITTNVLFINSEIDTCDIFGTNITTITSRPDQQMLMENCTVAKASVCNNKFISSTAYTAKLKVLLGIFTELYELGNTFENANSLINLNVLNTSNRPTNLINGSTVFDTDLGKPIYWNGTAWVDATGNPV